VPESNAIFTCKPRTPRALRHTHWATCTPKFPRIRGLCLVLGPEEGYRGTVTLRVSWILSLVLLAGVPGCSSQYVTRGAELYAGGFYIEAAEVFERTERRLDEASPSEQAQYGLYRGATLLALGDSRRARRWLRYSEKLLTTDPALLSEEERSMLRRALSVLANHSPEPAPERAQAAPAEPAIAERR